MTSFFTLDDRQETCETVRSPHVQVQLTKTVSQLSLWRLWTSLNTCLYLPIDFNHCEWTPDPKVATQRCQDVWAADVPDIIKVLGLQ